MAEDEIKDDGLEEEPEPPGAGDAAPAGAEDWHGALDSAWEHFGSAASEGLAGGAALLEALIMFGNDAKAPAAYSAVLPLLRVLKSLLEVWQLSFPEAEKRAHTYREAKRETLVTIRRVLAAEAKALGEKWPRSEEDESRLDVYRSITEIIDKEISRYRETPKEQEKPFRKVVIEE